MKNKPGTMKNHENRIGTMKNKPGTMKNYENRPGIMKNQPATATELDLRPLGKVIIFCDKQTDKHFLLYKDTQLLLK